MRPIFDVEGGSIVSVDNPLDFHDEIVQSNLSQRPPF